MKRIQIKPKEDFLPEQMIGPNKGMYKVFLNFNHSYYFKSKRDAFRFIAIANQFYTKIMYKARIIYIDLLNKYHKDWGYFDMYVAGKGSEIHYQYKCEHALNDIQQQFNLLSERSHWENGSSIAVGKLFLIVDLMKDAVSILTSMNEKRNSTMDLYVLDKLNEDIIQLEHSMKCFGDIEAKYLSKPSIHKPALPVAILEANKKMQVA